MPNPNPNPSLPRRCVRRSDLRGARRRDALRRWAGTSTLLEKPLRYRSAPCTKPTRSQYTCRRLLSHVLFLCLRRSYWTRARASACTCHCVHASNTVCAPLLGQHHLLPLATHVEAGTLGGVIAEHLHPTLSFERHARRTWTQSHISFGL